VENTKNIGDRTFIFGTIPPIEAIRVEVAVAKVIGEPLFRAFMDSKKTGSTEQDAEAAGAAAIGLLASNMNADDLIATMETVMRYVSVGDGSSKAVRCDINAHFIGRNKELWQVFIAALRFNFSDFLPDSLFASLPGAVKGSN
jgi:hypothetical protein